MTLTSYDQVPEELDKYCYVEFTMPTTQVSHTTVRSVSIVNSEKDAPPEKYLRLMARHEYRCVCPSTSTYERVRFQARNQNSVRFVDVLIFRVEIEHIHGQVEENPYLAATAVPRTPQPPPETKPQPNASDSDSST